MDWRERSSGISSDTVIAAWSRYSYKNQEEEKNREEEKKDQENKEFVEYVLLQKKKDGWEM